MQKQEHTPNKTQPTHTHTLGTHDKVSKDEEETQRIEIMRELCARGDQHVAMYAHEMRKQQELQAKNLRESDQVWNLVTVCAQRLQHTFHKITKHKCPSYHQASTSTTTSPPLAPMFPVSIHLSSTPPATAAMVQTTTTALLAPPFPASKKKG